MIKEFIYQENIAILNLHIYNNIAFKYMKQNKIDRNRGERQKSKIRLEDFSILLSVVIFLQIEKMPVRK